MFPALASGAALWYHKAMLTDARILQILTPALATRAFGAHNSFPAFNTYLSSTANYFPRLDKHLFGVPNSFPITDKQQFVCTNSLSSTAKDTFCTTNSLPATDKGAFGAPDTLPASDRHDFAQQIPSPHATITNLARQKPSRTRWLRLSKPRERQRSRKNSRGEFLASLGFAPAEPPAADFCCGISRASMPEYLWQQPQHIRRKQISLTRRIL